MNLVQMYLYWRRSRHLQHHEKFMSVNQVPVIICLALSVAGCGGGGSATVNEPPVTFLDVADGGDLAVVAVELTTNDASLDSSTGDFNAGDGSFSLVGQTGAVHNDRSAIDVDDGGRIALELEPNAFAGRFDVEVPGRSPSFGVVGIPTSAASLPQSGQASFEGNSKLTAQDGQDLYELTGSATIAVDFQSELVTLSVTDMEGQIIPVFSQASEVELPDQLVIADMQLNGSAFGGGSASLTGGTFGLTASVQTDTSGQIYGPNEEDIGGIFVIDDTENGTVQIFGDFLAGQ